MKNITQDFAQTIKASYDQLVKVAEADSMRRVTEDKWSKKEVIGHLIDSAANNHQRFVRAQLADNIALPGYEQEGWVKSQNYQTEAWQDLLLLWKSYNLHLLHVVSSISEDRLSNVCRIGNAEPVTLGFLIEDYVRHMKHHLQQVLG